MTFCNNSFAIKNVSTEDVYLQLPGIHVIHPGEIYDLLEIGIDLQSIANNEFLFIQFQRKRLIQIQVPGKTNINVSTLTQTGTKYTQYETEQLVRGCDFSGQFGPFNPLGSNGSNLTKVSALLGNDVNTKFRVTHNLETTEILVQVFSNLSPKDTVFPTVDRINDNQIEIQFNNPPSANQYTIIIIG